MAAKGNYFSDNEDLRFLLTKRLDFEKLFKWLSDEEKEVLSASTAEEYVHSWIEVLETLGEICGSTIAGNAEAVAHEDLALKDGEVVFPPALTENMNTLKEFGLPGLGVSPRWGGMGAPFVIESVGSELLQRACPSTTLNAVWYSPIAHIVDMFGGENEKSMVIPQTVEQHWSGCMALTEPDVGSDLANMRTYGEIQPDGSWKIYGTKRFISNGCGEYALLIGKNSKGAEGLNTVNLYLIPRKLDGKDNYRVSKLEEKVALHGSATCELEFDGSKGWLLGKDGEGFRYMLKLMNDARVAVALQGVGMMEAIHRMATEYAQQRQAFGKPIAEHEMIAAKLMDLEVETKALRSLCYQAAYARSAAYIAEAYLRRNPDLPEEERKEIEREIAMHNLRSRKWTPLIKWYAGERVTDHARTALNIHGGYGFSTEYKAEYWLRESLIISIYEGTSQIQALMCLKDSVKSLIRRPQKFLEEFFGSRFANLAEHSTLRRLLNKSKYNSRKADLNLMLKLIKANLKSSFSETSKADVLKMIGLVRKNFMKFENLRSAYLNAERYTEIKALEALGHALYEDAQTDPSRAWVAERFLINAVYRQEYLLALIDREEPVINAKLDEYDNAGKQKAG